MKIATYNVNGVNGRLPVLLRWLEQTEPDVVCLQELKAPQEKFPVAAIRSAGYGAIWHGQKQWNGVAILTRDDQPVERRRGLPETQMTSKADTSKMSLTGSSSAVSTSRMGTQIPAQSLTTSSSGLHA
jgi:exonuclease III